MDPFWLRPKMNLPELRPLPIDIVEDETTFTVKADVPGVTKEEIHVKAKDGVMTIEVESKKEETKKEDTDGVKYHRTERSHSFVSRSIKMPRNADLKHVKGRLHDGVLHLAVPKLDKVEKEEGERIAIE